MFDAPRIVHRYLADIPTSIISHPFLRILQRRISSFSHKQTISLDNGIKQVQSQEKCCAWHADTPGYLWAGYRQLQVTSHQANSGNLQTTANQGRIQSPPPPETSSFGRTEVSNRAMCRNRTSPERSRYYQTCNFGIARLSN